MRITHLSTAVMESNFDWTIVKVETDDHITGYGEAFLGPGLTAVIQEFGGILKGEDPTSIDRVLRRMRASCVHASPGLAFHAIHGIETALLDAIGKRYKLPIWQILGGKYRDHVRSEEHTSELQSLRHLVCRLLLEKRQDAVERDATRIAQWIFVPLFHRDEQS